MSSQADALRHELERHKAQGREDRVADILAELKALGESAPETAEAGKGETTAATRATRKK